MIKLTILGTGTFFVDKDRSSSAYLLEAGGKKILVDCGPGTLARLSQAGFKPEELDAIFITHFHADHTSDLFPLFMNYRLSDLFASSSKKLPLIAGPAGMSRFMHQLADIYKLKAFDNWDKIKLADAKKVGNIGSVKIEAFRVRHIPFNLEAKGYAYRFKTGGKIVSFSGDCLVCQGVKRASKNADLFICDASFRKGFSNTAHMTSDEIGKIAQAGRVKRLALTHLYPHIDHAALLREVKEEFSGETFLAKELQVLKL